MKPIFYAALLLALSIAPAFAGNMDSGLYAPAPPEGSAFVRFLNERNAAGSTEMKANNKGYDFLNYKEVTSYYVVPNGSVSTLAGDAKGSFTAEAGQYYTVVYNEGLTMDVKKDPQNTNQAKSQIVFYNLSNKPTLSLKTTDGKVEIIPALAAGEVGEKQINPVKVGIAVYDGDTVLKDLGTVSLERSKSYSVIVLDDNDVRWVASSTNTSR